MSWIRLEDGFPEHPKILGLPDAAFRLHIRAICYCARLLTDGLVAKAWLGEKGRSLKAVAQLVTAGLWELEPSGDYRIHDYLKHQQSRAQVEQKRTEAAERMQRAREVRANNSRSSPEVRSTEEKRREEKRQETPTALRAQPIVKRRDFNAAYEHPRFNVPQVWHDKRVDSLGDGEFGMCAFYKHLAAHVDANPREDTEPRFDWLTEHFNAWLKSRKAPASDVPSVEETRKRLYGTRA